MRNIGLSKLQNLLFVLFLFALTGCGASNSNIAGTEGASGKITAKFDWAADGKSTAKTVAAVPTGVLSVRLKITGPTVNGTTYTRVKASFPAADGGGTVAVTPGTSLIVTAEALGAGDVLLYEGFKREVTVTSGATTDLGTISMAAPNYKVADEPCLGCHENSRGITGQSIVADYKGSRHYSVTVSPYPKFGVNSVGCAGCHGPNHNDLTPSLSGRCAECHNSVNGFGSNTALRDKHYAAGVPLTNARFLSVANNNCSACHAPHNLSVGNAERADWAVSGHGDVNALPWMDYDFSTRADCNACHTPAGFVQAVGNGWTNTTVTAAVTAGGMQPLNCDGCHSSNDFKNSVRTLSAGTVNGGYTAGMGAFGSAAVATIQYPNVGESNVCVPCHATRENGKSVALGVTNFANASFKNPHYLGAAAVFYGKGGFQFYSSTSQTQYAPQAYTTKYGVVADGTIIPAAAASTSNSTPAIAVGDVLVGEKAPWSHGKLGMNNFQTTKTAEVVTAKGNLVYSGTKGQCVACHLGPKNTHSFDAFVGAEATWADASAATTRTLTLSNGSIKYGGCYGCHTNEDMKEVAELDEKPKYDEAMAFFRWQLDQVGAVYSDAYPYFYNKAATPAALKNWIATDTAVGMVVPGGNGAANMGAALNYKLLAAERGAHVHNRTFMKQLIFDSVQYLQKGTVSFSHRNIAAGGSTDPNGLINFGAYSTAVGGLKAQTARNYIVRKNTSGITGGTAAVPVYTRN
jgi:hypothetical protein